MGRLPQDTTIGAVHLTVADLPGTAAFYRDVLGFRSLPRAGVIGADGSSPGAAAVGDTAAGGTARGTGAHAAAAAGTAAPGTTAPGATGPGAIAPGTAGPAEVAAGPILGLSVTGEPPYDLVLHRSAPGAVRRRAAGLYHFAILLPARADLARALRHLIEAGAPIEGASDHAVSEAVYLHDPEGNGIEIYADRPRERWPRRNGRLEMTTRPLDVEDLFRGGAGSWEGLPAGTRIGHMHLRVNDLGLAEAFYSGILGFDVTVRGYPGALFVAAGGYHHHIGLNTWAGPLEPAPPEGVGLRYFTIRVPDRAAREEVLARAGAFGLTPRAGEGGAALLRDPDGIGVMLTD